MLAPDAKSEQTLGKVLADRAARLGDKPFIVTDHASHSYAEIDAWSNRLANGLAALGIAPGETVLVMLTNTVEFVALWCGLGKLGAIEVPVNTAYRGDIFAHVINNSGATTMVVEARFLERLAEVAPRLETLERLIVTGESKIESLGKRFEIAGWDVMEVDNETPIADGPRHLDLKAVMYTAGTTGLSKGVMITHSHAYNYAACGPDLLELGADDIYYAPLPLFHIAGQWAVVYAAMIAGASAVLTDRFSIEAFWDDVRRHGATATFLLGAMANFLYRQEPRGADADNPLKKALIVPLFPEIEDFKRRFDCQVTTTYGSTEVGVPVTASFDLPNARVCGRVKDELFEVRLVDEDDEEVPVGTVGELVVRPREPWLVMAGYWRDPEQTEVAWRNLWLHSGDTMYRDEDGWLYFSDRLADCIRRRGENISSLEVENQLYAHDAVFECAVFGVPSEHTEEDVMATLVLKPGAGLEPADLIAFLKPRMPSFMVPRYVNIIDALSKTPTGKIQKTDLRAQGVTPTTWDREAGKTRRSS
ncbi:MAG: AMP-binding protein [Alphaproteobacteria bacterium]